MPKLLFLVYFCNKFCFYYAKPYSESEADTEIIASADSAYKIVGNTDNSIGTAHQAGD
jgi:hypothetical protein